MLQNITIKYLNTVVAPKTNPKVVPAPVEQTITFVRNLETAGYTVTRELLQHLLTLNTKKLTSVANQIITAVSNINGSQFVYAPMYPNFPEQVVTATEMELWINSFVHYFGDLIGTRIIPEYTKNPRAVLPEHEGSLKTLTFVTENETQTVLEEIFTTLYGSKIALNKSQHDDLKQIQTLLGHTPTVTNIPVKENLVHYITLLPDTPEQLKTMLDTFNNPTDILRLFAVKGGSNPTLTGSIKFPKIGRPVRNIVLNRLNQFSEPALTEAHKRNSALWKVFYKHVHYGDYATKYPLHGTVTKLRANQTVDVYTSTIENALNIGDIEKAVNKLQERPGMFIRRARELATRYPEQQELILTTLAAVAPKASTTVLWQAYGAFKTGNPENRIIFSKGLTLPPTVIPAGLPLDPQISETFANTIYQAILDTYSTRNSLGKVFLTKGAHQPTIPFGLRSTSPTAKMVGRGSRFMFDKNQTLRFFLHWKNLNDTRVDIDLSATLLDENFSYIEDIAYYNLRGEMGYHSGDLTSAPDGASEYIDINVPKTLGSHEDARYVAMTVTSYTGQPFTILPETFAGFMTRNKVQSGEIFEPKTVNSIFQVNASTTHAIPFLFDLKTGEAIFVDLPTRHMDIARNARNTLSETSQLLKAITERAYPTVQDVLMANVLTRATSYVNTPEEADTIVNTDIITIPDMLTNWL